MYSLNQKNLKIQLLDTFLLFCDFYRLQSGVSEFLSILKLVGSSNNFLNRVLQTNDYLVSIRLQVNISNII